ncbi:MAG TPA: pyrroline-5-carboxylate reductase [Caulobacteraceae bacterium]|jgi:pyrroline-5-carboxylate reductase|nr:pyrroline-5-carboxylate reductase [Caulobacteraceae bacterium]
MTTTPILLLGAGRMGGALTEGWSRAGAFAPSDLMLLDPNPSPEALAAAQAGAVLNPSDDQVRSARTVLLAVKPQVWRDAAAAQAPRLAPDAVVVSIAAGVRLDAIAEAFGGRPVARVMPTTAVAIGQGVASIYAPDPVARARAHALFGPVATVAYIGDEAQMDAVTAVSGSGPAYLYAFVEALEAAAEHAGLSRTTAQALARATVAGAAGLMMQSGADPAELRRQVTSPAGTTEAALKVLMAGDGLGPLLRRAVDAAAARSRELGS